MTPTLDLDRLRRDTPACTRVLHLDHAGSSLPPERVLNAVIEQIRREGAVGGYRAFAEASDALDAFYVQAGRALGVPREAIAFFDSATRAWHAVLLALRLGPGDRVLVHETAYSSNQLAFDALAERGIVLEHLGSQPSGELDLDALRAALQRPAALVAITHIPTWSGLIQPVAAIGALAEQAGVPVLLDACQSLGQVPLDLPASGIDFATATGRKFARGPRGSGLLAVHPRWLDRLQPLLVDTWGAPRGPGGQRAPRPDLQRFELFERSVAAQLGLGEALALGNDLGWDAISDRIRALGASLRERLGDVPGVQLLDRGSELGGIVPFLLDDAEPADVQRRLRQQDIHVSVTTVPPRGAWVGDPQARRAVRASVHALNTEDELARFVEALV